MSPDPCPAVPLEDLAQDVLGKACRGLGMSQSRLAAAAGVTPAQVAAALAGDVVEDSVLLALAGPLGLRGPALVELAHGAWRPEPVALDGLAQFTTPFDDMTVNSWLVWDPATREAVAFDTGADAAPMIAFLASLGLRLTGIFITHTHTDHVMDLSTLRRATGSPPVWSHALEPLAGTETFRVEPATGWSVGGLRITPRSTHGHSKAGITYVIAGLARPVAVVGDAVFAGSMGGGAVSYADALRTNHAEIFTLPDDTVLCPGHGPATTVGAETLHNPFFQAGLWECS